MQHIEKASAQLNEIFSTLWPEVYRYAYYKVQNKEEAEEITQEVFQKVFQKIENDEVDQQSMKHYIFRAVKNTVIDLWRKKGRSPSFTQIDNINESSLVFQDIEKETEDSIMVQEALSLLPIDSRKVLTYRILEGYSVEETAILMSRSAGAIKSLQYRALKMLQKELKKGGYFDEQ